ncbi:hypothetical protein N780_03695 [Pontibacillus chungwhensis BH030062]|uniref:Uncharacterized protein n=1 Tax=Pontibacillus chungwhensis BH030062 TaxID=1385513 RepID=A0A0A2UR96_9BACI|nr:hypothetical protein [Pontibacillus chungwhensis]KGP90807.1 hypothetical protein N780_03695 [Pontibacillus chungwhensis BH030062]
MEVSVDALFYFYLGVLGVISFLGGLLAVKKWRSITSGFWVMVGMSVLFLVFLFRWFQTPASEAYMGTIPWLFNQALAIILYGVWIIIAWFALKRFGKKSFLNVK